MKQETRKALNLTAEYAARALHFLIADGKLAIRDVTTALSRRKKLVKELKDRFTALETGGVVRTAKARGGASSKAAARKAGRNGREISTARAKAGARSTAKAAGEATRKKTIARSARRRASTQKAATKAAVSSRQTRRPGTIRAKTKKPAQTAAAAATEQRQRPDADTESGAPTSAPAASTEGRRLPKVANPEHEGRGPAPRDWNQA